MDEEWIELLARGGFTRVLGLSVQGAAVYTIAFDGGPLLFNVDELLRYIYLIYKLTVSENYFNIHHFCT